MEIVDSEDIRAVLQDALENAEDEYNVTALKRILNHFETSALFSLS